MRTRHTISSRGRQQRWLRAGSVLISFAAITLLATAFGARLYSGSLSSVLLTLVLIALCIAIVLHVRFLLLARREHRETANALDRRFCDLNHRLAIWEASVGRSSACKSCKSELRQSAPSGA